MTTPAEFATLFSQMGAAIRPQSEFVSGLLTSIGDDPPTAALLGAAPATQQNPLLLVNVVHSLVLADPTSELANYYPTVTDSPRAGDPYPVFAEFCRTHRAEVAAGVATRRTQTNEVGRSALFLIGLGVLADELDRALALVDVGTSAGLNLQLDRFAYEYTDTDGDITRVGDDSPVVLGCGTRGGPPIPTAIPEVAARVGVDQTPIDLADPEARRWLTACVWPDQPHRFHRLEAAIDMAVAHPPRILTADAVSGLAPAFEHVGDGGHPVVLNSWVLNYLTPHQRRAYLAELDRIGATRDLSWIYLEDPALAAGLPYPPAATGRTSTLMLVRWRAGRRHVRHLGDAHPHGKWLHWSGIEISDAAPGR